VFDASGNDEKLIRTDDHVVSAPHANGQATRSYKEEFVGFVMCVPHELSLEFDGLEVHVVDLSNDHWRPVVVECVELLAQLNDGIGCGHTFSPDVDSHRDSVIAGWYVVCMLKVSEEMPSQELDTDQPVGRLLPMDEMPGAVLVGQIPFGEEDAISAIRTVGVCCEGIPGNLDDLEPGPVLAGFLASIDVSEVSGVDQIVVMRAHRRMVSHYQGHVYRDMSAVTDTIAGRGDLSDDAEAAVAAEAEIGVALHMSRRASENELAFALNLAKRDMLTAGVIDVARARAIDRYTLHLTDIAAQAVLDQIADDAPRLTVGQLRARIQKLCIVVDPHESVTRYEQAIADRRVVAEYNDTGTVNLLGMDLAPDQVAAVTDRINTIARSMRSEGETRSMDQLRADIYLDLLSGTNHQTARRGVTFGSTSQHSSVWMTTLANSPATDPSSRTWHAVLSTTRMMLCGGSPSPTPSPGNRRMPVRHHGGPL